jgi:hypothetical protein
MRFNTTQLKRIVNKDGSKIVKYQIYKKDLTPMTADELKTLSAVLLKKGKVGTDFNIVGHSDKLKADAPVSIQGLNIANWRTLKAFGKDINYMDEEEYYEGKAKDTSKFNQYYQATITLLIPPSK